MTLLYLEWHLIWGWPLINIFAQFPEQLLKDFVSWGSPDECSMVDRFLGDAFGILSCLFWSTVLFCCVVLSCWYIPQTTWLCSQWCLVSNWGCVWVWHFSLSICGSTLCIRSGVTQCTRKMMLYLDCMWQCGLHTMLLLHIGILTLHLAAEPRCTAGLLFPSQCPSKSILLTQSSMVWNFQISRAGPMLFYWR